MLVNDSQAGRQVGFSVAKTPVRSALMIAAPSFSVVSETFIRDHVRTILPGATTIIAQDAVGADAMGVPALAPCPSWEPPRTLPDRVVKSIGARFRRHVRDGLRSSDAANLAAFIQLHRPTALLVQYLDHAAKFVDIARATGTPLYAYAHGYEVAAARIDRRVRRHVRRVFSNATAILAATHYMERRLIDLDCPHEKIRIAPSGIDPDRFPASSAEPKRLIAIGRLVSKKAPHITIEAFAKAAGNHPGAHLDVVGDGPLMGRCREVVAEYGVADSVTLHGSLPSEQVVGLLARAAVFVQHSVMAPNGDTEGLGVSLLEAMASSVPVVATRHNGFVETVVEGETGLLVDEYDLDAMAAAIDGLLSDPDRARAMGAAGRVRVLEKFTQTTAAAQMRRAMDLTMDLAA